MSGMTWTCDKCGKVNTIMLGSPPFCDCPGDQAELEAEIQESIRKREAYQAMLEKWKGPKNRSKKEKK